MFNNRQEAGAALAAALMPYKGSENTLVVGLARGGVVVAAEIAKKLSLPLNVAVPRKIGAPGNPELALGSIMENGEGVFNHSIIHMLGVSREYLDREIKKEQTRAQQRLALYRPYVPSPSFSGKKVLLVDDGMATGSTMLATIKAMRTAQATQVLVAIPVASTEALGLAEEAADKVVCLLSREDFIGVGMYYRHFDQTSDEEVIHLLKEANANSVPQTASPSPPSEKNTAFKQELSLPLSHVHLVGELTIPERAQGIVLFAHGSGSGRLSPRNQFVARALQEKGLATLLVDLLTVEEEQIDALTGELRFNIPFLTERLSEITSWILKEEKTRALSIGYFGASTGAAAALMAAAEQGEKIAAIVSRGGRPDLADSALPEVKAPTLLIVGGRDEIVIELNKRAYAQLTCRKELRIVPKATHLFEEPGALEEVAQLASEWFLQYLHK